MRLWARVILSMTRWISFGSQGNIQAYVHSHIVVWSREGVRLQCWFTGSVRAVKVGQTVLHWQFSSQPEWGFKEKLTQAWFMDSDVTLLSSAMHCYYLSGSWSGHGLSHVASISGVNPGRWGLFKVKIMAILIIFSIIFSTTRTRKFQTQNFVGKGNTKFCIEKESCYAWPRIWGHPHWIIRCFG